jgi:hypothetical protein
MKQIKDSTEMGHNRTGVSVSPAEARKTAAGALKGATQGNETKLAEARAVYIVESQAVGSLPEPARRNGARRTSKNGALRLLLDKLSEREAFERMGVRLYDALITKVEASRESGAPSAADLRRLRTEELEHFHLVAERLKRLGGDNTAESPCADVMGVASRGLTHVVTDPRTSVAQSLSALLTAELTDNAGWELLIQLCDKLGEDKMAAEFQKALAQEAEHLEKVRRWVSDGLLRKLG